MALSLSRLFPLLYDLWYQQRDEIFQTYSRNPAERLLLSQNSEFKPIRNAVVQEASKLLGLEHGQENSSL